MSRHKGQTTPRTLSISDLHEFGCLTGDYSRIHFDKAFSEQQTGGHLVHGLLTASFALGTLVRDVFPGELSSATRLSGFSVNHRLPVFVGDTLTTHYEYHDMGSDSQSLDFNVFNASGDCVSDGSCVLNDDAGSRTQGDPWDTTTAEPEISNEIRYVQDYAEDSAVYQTVGRTLTESDVLRYGSLFADLDELSTNLPLAQASGLSALKVQPMLCFNLFFAAWLNQWMKQPHPDAGFAGHIADEWQQLQPVAVGDTLYCRYRTEDARLSRSRPDRGILTFGLQLVNQRGDVVQQGKVLMLYPAR